MTRIVSRQPDRLFKLLPALYQIADAEQGDGLKALLALITQEADALRDNTQQLWDDFFIETCQRWLVPYIGELIANVPLHDLDPSAAAATAQALFADLSGPDLRPPGALPLRADVARTIQYRRRKGTTVMLEELARDVTGWGAHVVEFFQLLDWNQHLEHLRLDCHGCPDLRRLDTGDLAGGPWDSTTHTVDVRRIEEREGWHNIANLGFFLWRLKAYPLTRITPREIGGTPWRLTFNPLGQDMPLFSDGFREPDEWRQASEAMIQAPIRAAAFFEDLAGLAPGAQVSLYYGDPSDQGLTGRSLVVFDNGRPVPASDVSCRNLANWQSLTPQPAGTTVLIDVARGRRVVPSGRKGPFNVSCLYGFSMNLGGGEYRRSKWLVKASQPANTTTLLKVSGGGQALATALAASRPTLHTIIEIDDCATYLLGADIVLKPGETLTIQAADQKRPHLLINTMTIAVQGGGFVNDAGASLTLGGLLIEGALRIEADLALLRLLHTTLVPGLSVLQESTVIASGPSIEVSADRAGAAINTSLELQLAFSITGALRLPTQVSKLWLLDSIVVGIESNGGPPVPAVSDSAGNSGPPAHIERCTFFGSAHFLKLELASESIFTGPLQVEQRQQGCLRFCYVPPVSLAPQQYRCQPALEIDRQKERRRAEANRRGTPLPTGWEAQLEADVGQWLVPSFQSERYGRPVFAQLRRTSPVQIRTGAADGSEMGVFCVLKQPQRQSNLLLRLEEYLPVGLEAGLIYVN